MENITGFVNVEENLHAQSLLQNNKTFSLHQMTAMEDCGQQAGFSAMVVRREDHLRFEDHGVSTVSKRSGTFHLEHSVQQTNWVNLRRQHIYFEG